jgi:hypothetical protein
VYVKDEGGVGNASTVEVGVGGVGVMILAPFTPTAAPPAPPATAITEDEAGEGEGKIERDEIGPTVSSPALSSLSEFASE